MSTNFRLFLSVLVLSFAVGTQAQSEQRRQPMGEKPASLIDRSDGTSLRAAGFSVGQSVPVPGHMWVNVVNAVTSANVSRASGERCSINEKGRVAIQGIQSGNLEHIIVTYRLPGRAYGARCPDGAMFSVAKSELSQWPRMAAERLAREDAFARKIQRSNAPSLRAAGFFRGQHIPVPGHTWITVINAINSGNVERVRGDSCSINENGHVTAHSAPPGGEDILVTYRLPERAYGARCPDGAMFFVAKDTLFQWLRGGPTRRASALPPEAPPAEDSSYHSELLRTAALTAVSAAGIVSAATTAFHLHNRVTAKREQKKQEAKMAELELFRMDLRGVDDEYLNNLQADLELTRIDPEDAKSARNTGSMTIDSSDLQKAVEDEKSRRRAFPTVSGGHGQSCSQSVTHTLKEP